MTRSMIAAGLAIAAVIALAIVIVELAGTPPRDAARYIERRASGHNPAIVGAGNRIGALLRRLDRGDGVTVDPAAIAIGARGTSRSDRTASPAASPVSPAAPATIVPVSTTAALLAAIDSAEPGHAITLAPGLYRLGGRPNVDVARPGRADAPIAVRAEIAGTAIVELDMTEGFRVSAPYWTFENLDIRGACAAHDGCEHAFHVVGPAAHFVARGNSIADFNAHFKVNGENGRFPDAGRIDGNVLVNRSARQTSNPVTPVDIVAASGWTIAGNVIADFVKAQGDLTSYGAFAKGGAAGTVFERNVVICEHRLRGAPGQRVGLSVGGGGSEGAYCRSGDCAVEHTGGAIRANLIQSCSDDGIYVNRGKGIAIAHNTLLDTGGISVRYPQSDAAIDGNLVDGLLRARDGGSIRASDNVVTRASELLVGRHPVRALFGDPARLSWNGEPPRRAAPGGEPPPDLCGAQRPPRPAYGAFEDFGGCLRR